MTQVRRANAVPRESDRPWIWGTGSIGPHRTDFIPNVSFAAVRGPITACLMGNDSLPCGDPGLLVGELFEGKLPKRKKFKIGVILHHSQTLSVAGASYVEQTRNARFINVKRLNAFDVVSQISECEFVMSSSLHGLIVADALRIPNIWLDPRDIHGTARFKFYDYAASIGRAMGVPANIEEYINNSTKLDDVDTSYFPKLAKVTEALHRSFPENLS